MLVAEGLLPPPAQPLPGDAGDSGGVAAGFDADNHVSCEAGDAATGIEDSALSSPVWTGFSQIPDQHHILQTNITSSSSAKHHPTYGLYQ